MHDVKEWIVYFTSELVNKFKLCMMYSAGADPGGGTGGTCPPSLP